MAWRGPNVGQVRQWSQLGQGQANQVQQLPQLQVQNRVNTQAQWQQSQAPANSQNWQPSPNQQNQQTQQAPRLGAVVTPPAASAPQQAPSSNYIVSCNGPDHEEVVVRTLVGEFVEHSSNHGCKVFKKLPEQGPNAIAVEVFLYYWDGRDGPAFQGWWFGNQLGGTQVWSHIAVDTPAPPSTGWKIPWDGAVRSSIRVLPKAEHERVEAQEKVRGIATIVSEATKAAREALDQAKRTAGNNADLEALKAGEQALSSQVKDLTDALQKLAEAQSGTSGEAAKHMSHMSTQLRTMQQMVNAELTKARIARERAEKDSKQKAAEGRDMATLQDILVEATQKADLAEDHVEKAVIASEVISTAGEDMDVVKAAVATTEQAVQQAQKAIGEARIFLNAKQATTRHFESDAARQKAQTELTTKLQGQLQAAQAKLNPLRTVRQDFQQRAAAQKVSAEVLDKLVPAEVDVDRAEEASALILPDAPTKDLIATAEKAVGKAADNVSHAIRFIEQKMASVTGLAKKELDKLEERGRSSQKRLLALKEKHRAASERVTCEVILKEAGEKLQSVSEAVMKAAEAEGPFLMGVEELPLEDTLTTVKACESAATSANTAVSIARMFIATKLVEAKRFTKGPSEWATRKLKEFQAQLESNTKRLGDLKKATLERKQKAFLVEARNEVQRVEALAKEVVVAAAVFEDDEKLLAMSPSEIKEASEETHRAETAANTALMETRKFITARQIEAKGKDASSANSSDLVKYQARLSTAQAEVTKYKKLAASVGQRLAAKRSVDEAIARIGAAEDKITAVEEAVKGFSPPAPVVEGQDEKAAEEENDTLKAAEALAADAATALKQVTRYMDTELRGTAKDEFAKLEPRTGQAHGRLEKALAAMRDRAELHTAALLLRESNKHIVEAEASVKKAQEAEVPFKREDEPPVDEASKLLLELETAVGAANTSIAGTKTFLAMKRLVVKRLGDAVRDPTAESLNALQTQLDSAMQTLGDIKKGMMERKSATVRRELAATVKDVEAKVSAAEEVSVALADKSDATTDQMKGACEKASASQAAAQTAITDARNVFIAQQRDAKVSQPEVNTTMLEDIGKALDQLADLQATLDTQKGLLREQEHKFVARRLLNCAGQLGDKVDKKMELASKLAAPLTSESKEELMGVAFLGHIFDMLKAHLKSTEKTAKALFDDIGENTGKFSVDQFVAFCTKLLELDEHKDVFFSDEHMRASFKIMLKDDATEVDESAFLEQFRSKFIVTTLVAMTDGLTVKGSKTVRKLESGEIVEALGEAEKEPNIGVLRLKAKTEKDEKEGYISLAGNQGTRYLQPYSAYAALQKQIEKALTEVEDSTREALKYIDQKLEDLKSVRPGSLAETRAELQRMRPRISGVRSTVAELRDKVSSTKYFIEDTMDEEKRKRHEAAEKKAAAATLEEVQALERTVKADVEKIMPGVDALVKNVELDEENPLGAMGSVEQELEALFVTMEKAANTVKEHLDGIKGSTKGAMGELRSALVKMKVNFVSMESKCRKQAASLTSARKQVEESAHAAVAGALRTYGQTKQLSPEVLFNEISKDADKLTSEQLREFLSKIPDAPLKAGQLDLGLERFSGLTKVEFLEVIQEYQRCVKEIAITSKEMIKESKTLRKLAVGEMVEIVDPEKKDAQGMWRARCRAVTDGVEGWVTTRGNQGTNFLEKCSKPYYTCQQEVPFHSAFESSSSEIRKLRLNEVLEVLEGPRKEAASETQRMRCKAQSDGKSGWVTMKEKKDVFFDLDNSLVSTQSIPLTSSSDLTDSQEVRKLDVGETVVVLEQEAEDSTSGLWRAKVRATRDNQEGWITVKDNQGTSFAEPNTKLYTCRRSTPMETRLASGSSAVRALEVGETVELLEGPKNDSKDVVERIKGRTVDDGTVGWFTPSPTSSSGLGSSGSRQ
eukprot:TRINITY_DN10374_c0_g1_i1.p1 TRINITY_DN10374_c0_g1~~TRINITY_DN10374_c0_g1_i1.p1  ORF type:complete len:1956 (-),score=521.59 TRINITY_DN10374_c0_g1_i1:151-5910(-)